MQVKVTPSKVSGTITIPASKSMAHRAIICASLAKGTSVVSNITYSKDIDATIQCMEALGATIEKKETSCIVHGCDVHTVKNTILCDCSESGSTLRFLIPIASLSNQEVHFIGQGRLMDRPMHVYKELFDKQNLPFTQNKDGIQIHGSLNSGDYQLRGDISSQFITGLLFTLPLLNGDSTIEILPPYESKSYVDLTLSMLKEFGIHIEETSYNTYSIQGNQEYVATDVSVEGDCSQMAFYAVLAALNNALTCKNIKPDSKQGDKAILEQVKNAGAYIDIKNTDITITPHERKKQIIDLANCPDLGPILCVLGSFIPATTKIIHARRLRMKESDRIEAMETELKKWGVDISSTEDEITIHGKESYTSNEVVKIHGHNDHRIVMAMTVFGLCANSPSTIDDAQAISKSYPDFFKDIESIHGKVEIL